MSDVQALDDAGPPFPVFVALGAAYALAATLLLMGLLGFFIGPLWRDVALFAVAGVVYLFTGPTSAIIGSLVVAALGAGTFALLFLPEASKRFYAA